MKTPSFRYMGGKARLRKWLLAHFPKEGRAYIEPFAGVGNVFFLAKRELRFKYFVLNEPNSQLLHALKIADLELLPEKVSKEDFAFWKSSKCLISQIIEPRITFAGKGYSSGFSGSSGTHVGYDKQNYFRMCNFAQYLLKYDVTLYKSDYLEILNWDFASNDFIYLDPPYFETKSSYSNINHNQLIACLNNIPNVKWALSGYDNELYDKNLQFKNKYQIERNSEIKSSNANQYEGVVETLWTNY